MIQRSDTVLDEYQRPVPGASVYVYNQDGTDASITSDGTTPLTQPVITDEFGTYTYWANTGYYREDIWYGGKLRYSQANIAIGSPGADLNLRSDLAANTGATLVKGSNGKTIEDSLLGGNRGTVGSGNTDDLEVLRQFNGASDGTTAFYGERRRVFAQGSVNIDHARVLYLGAHNQVTSPGVVANLEAVHAYCWPEANSSTASAVVYAAHVRPDTNAQITIEADAYLVPDISLMTGANVARMVGLSVKNIGHATQVGTAVGAEIADFGALTTAIGVRVLTAAATNKYAIFADGGAQSAHLGKFKFGAASAPAEVVDINGNLIATGKIRSNGDKIGYATGAGGTATQITSKSTLVEVDHPCGQITMNNAALAANTIVSFTLQNSFIGPDDRVSVWVKSGNASVGSYRVGAEGNATGSRTIVVENKTAGSLSEALVLGFEVHSSVTS